jgi:hypothetical protein
MAVAITSATGFLTHGSTLTITGTGFGTKTTAAPLKFDSFEAGTPGQNVTGWGTDSASGYGLIKYSTDVSRGVGSVASKHPFNPTDYNLSLCLDGTFPIIYLDFWQYFVRIDNVSRNFKSWRLWAADTRISVAEAEFGNGTGSVYIYDAVTDTYHLEYTDSPNMTQPPGVWRHFQVAYKQSTISVADGALLFYIDGTDIWSSLSQITRSHDDQVGAIRVGHYWACEDPSNSGATQHGHG